MAKKKKKEKKRKRQTIHKTIHGKLKIEQHEPYYKPGVNSDELWIQQMRISTNKEKHMQFEIKKKKKQQQTISQNGKIRMKWNIKHITLSGELLKSITKS